MKIFTKDDYINNSIISSSLKNVTGNIPAHGHNFFELEFIVDGTGIYEIDGIEYEIKKNTLFFMTPANLHALRNANATLINVMFSHEQGKEKNDIAIFMANSPCFTFEANDGVFLCSILKELVKVNDTDTSYALLLINCIMNKLYYSFKSPKSHLPNYTQQAVIYMLENFQNDISLNDVSKHIGLSDAYFSTVFRKQTTINFKDYLDDIRFSYAKKLLSLTSLSIKEIIFKSGFRDYANFTRRFKQKYNVTPTDYRNNHYVKR